MAKTKKGDPALRSQVENGKPCTQVLPSLSQVQQPCGLNNLGNTCYFNSALQLLVSCHQLTMPLAGVSPGGSAGENSKPTAPGSSGPLGFALKQAIMHMYGTMRPPILAPAPGAASTQPSTYNPQALLAAVCRHAPQFKEKQQHDAHELLHCLLDGLQTEESRLHAYMQKSQRRLSTDTPPSTTPSTSTPSLPVTPMGPSPQSPLAQQHHNPAAPAVLPPYHQNAHSQLQHSPSSPLPSMGSPTFQTPSPRQLSPLTAPPPSAVEKAFGGLLGSTIACHGCGHTSVSSEPFLDLSLPIPSTHKPPPPPKDTASSNSSRTGSDAQRSGLKKKKERATGSEATTLVDDALAVGKKGKKDKQPQQQQQQQQQQLAVSDGKKALPLKQRRKLEAEAKRQAVMDARASKRKHRQLLDDVAEEVGSSGEREGEEEGGVGEEEMCAGTVGALKVEEDGVCKEGAEGCGTGGEVQTKEGGQIGKGEGEERLVSSCEGVLGEANCGSGREWVQLGHKQPMLQQGQQQQQQQQQHMCVPHGVQEQALHSLQTRAGGDTGLRGSDSEGGAGVVVSSESARGAQIKPANGQSARRQGWEGPCSRLACTSSSPPTCTSSPAAPAALHQPCTSSPPPTGCIKSGSASSSSSTEDRANNPAGACPDQQEPVSASLHPSLPAVPTEQNTGLSSSNTANVVVVGFEVPPAAAANAACCASARAPNSSMGISHANSGEGTHEGREGEIQRSEMVDERGVPTLLPVSRGSPGTPHEDGGTLLPPPLSSPSLQYELQQQQQQQRPLNSLCMPCPGAAELALQQQQQQQEQHLPFTPRSIRTSSHSSLTSLLRGTANNGSSSSSSLVDMLRLGGSSGSAAGDCGSPCPQHPALHQHHHRASHCNHQQEGSIMCCSPGMPGSSLEQQQQQQHHHHHHHHHLHHHQHQQYQQDQSSRDVRLSCMHHQHHHHQQQPPLERPLLNGGEGAPEQSPHVQHPPVQSQPRTSHPLHQDAQGSSTMRTFRSPAPSQEETPLAAVAPGTAGVAASAPLPRAQLAHKHHSSMFEGSQGGCTSGQGSHPENHHGQQQQHQQQQQQQPTLAHNSCRNSSNSSSHMQLHLLPPQHQPPPRPSPTPNGCAPPTSAAAGASVSSDAAPYSVPHAPPHLLDCLVAFFQAEPLIWECPREHDLAKKRARARYQFHHPQFHHAHSHPHPTDLLHLTQHSHGAHHSHHSTHATHHHSHHHQEHHSRRAHAAVHVSPPPPTSYPHTLPQPSPIALPTPQVRLTSSPADGTQLPVSSCPHFSPLQHACEQTSQSLTPPAANASALSSHQTQTPGPIVTPRSIPPSTSQEASLHYRPDQNLPPPSPRHTSSHPPHSLFATQGPMGSAAPPSLAPCPPLPHHSFNTLHSPFPHPQVQYPTHTLRQHQRDGPGFGPGMSTGVEPRDAWHPQDDHAHLHLPLSELSSHILQHRHQQQPSQQHLLEPQDLPHNSPTADGPGRKQVSFCPLPPRVFGVPGVEEQRGTHIGSALAGQAAFMRPVRCPLPEPHPQQGSPSRNSAPQVEPLKPCSPGLPSLEHPSNSKAALAESLSAPPLQCPHNSSGTVTPSQAELPWPCPELPSASMPASNAAQAGELGEQGLGRPTWAAGSGHGNGVRHETGPMQQQRQGEAGAYVDDSGFDEDGGVHRGRHEGTVLLLVSARLDPKDLNVLNVCLEAGANQWGTGVGRESPCHAVLPGGRPIRLATLDISRAWQHARKASGTTGGASLFGCPCGDGARNDSSGMGGDGCDDGGAADVDDPCGHRAPAVVGAVLAAMDCAAHVVEVYGAAAAPSWLSSMQLQSPPMYGVAPLGSAAPTTFSTEKKELEQQDQEREQQMQQQEQQQRHPEGRRGLKQLHLEPSENGETGPTSSLPCSTGAGATSCWQLRGRVPAAAAAQQLEQQTQVAEPQQLVQEGRQEQEHAEHPVLCPCMFAVAGNSGGLLGLESPRGNSSAHDAAAAGDGNGMQSAAAVVEWVYPGSMCCALSAANTASAPAAASVGLSTGLMAEAAGLQARPSSPTLSLPQSLENGHEGHSESDSCMDRPRLRGGAVPLLTSQQERRGREEEQGENGWHGEVTQEHQQQQNNNHHGNAMQQQQQQAPAALPIPPRSHPLTPSHQHYPPSPSPSFSPLLSSPSPSARPPLLSPPPHFPSLNASSPVACTAPSPCARSSPAAAATSSSGAGGGGLGVAASSVSPQATAALSSAASLPPSPLSCMSPKLSSVERQALKRPASKAYHLQKAPPVMLLHLKRFQPDSRGRWCKVDSHVAFDMHLDVSPFVPPPAPAMGSLLGTDPGCATIREGGVQDNVISPYHLVGVIEHTGSMKAGHYVAYVRRPLPSSTPQKPMQDDESAPTPQKPVQDGESAPAQAAAGREGGEGGEQAAGKHRTPAGKSGKKGKQRNGKDGPNGREAGDEDQEGGSGACYAWFCISDTSVRQVTAAQVLRAQAYVLMYAQSGHAGQD